jgi:hypothetical protein
MRTGNVFGDNAKSRQSAAQLLDGRCVAVDGSRFKAVNHREKNFTEDRLTRRMAAIKDTIGR